MNAKDALAGLRATIGVSAWLAPSFSGRLFGLDPAGNPQASYLARLFAVRDLALAAGTLAADSSGRRLWLQAGIGCDLADAAAAILGGRDRTLPAFTTVLTAGTALAAAGLGVAALSQPADQP
jgi:hypothetical protein